MKQQNAEKYILMTFRKELKNDSSVENADKRTDHTVQNFSLYPLRELRCAKVDFDLDSWLHPCRQIPQQHQIQPPPLPPSYRATASAPQSLTPDERQAQIFELTSNNIDSIIIIQNVCHQRRRKSSGILRDWSQHHI